MEINQDTNIFCLSDYLKIIERLKEDYPPNSSLPNPTKTNFLYRGIPDQEYSLLPSVFRIQEENANKTYLAWSSEREILRSFMQEAKCYVSLPSNQWLQWAEYAQHYGAPTRLLDWSSNPLVALYFACRDKKDCDGKVWLLHYPNYTHFAMAGIPKEQQNQMLQDIVSDIINGRNKEASGNSYFKYPIPYAPYYVDARMSAQSSWLMIWGTEEAPLEDLIKGQTYQMNYIEQQPSVKVCYWKEYPEFWHCFFIHANRKQSILRELNTLGINEKALFPGLDGIGRYIEKKFRFDYAEACKML